MRKIAGNTKNDFLARESILKMLMIAECGDSQEIVYGMNECHRDVKL